MPGGNGEDVYFPPDPPSLRQMILYVATLGGFLGRKSDGQPGTEVMWKGLQRMDDIALTYEAIAELLRSGPLNLTAVNPSPRKRQQRRSRE